MVARALACVLIAACGSSSSSPKTAPSLTTAHRGYTISTGLAGGATHTTTLSADVPTAWHERYDDKSGSPAFETAPNDTVMILNVIELTPAAMIQGLFDDAKSPQRSQVGDYTWVVDHRADGGVHAAMVFAAPAGTSVLCDVRLNAKRADQLEAIKHICGTMKIDSVEDKAAPTDPAVTDPPKPHDAVITPKKVKVKDIVQPVLIEKQPK